MTKNDPLKSFKGLCERLHQDALFALQTYEIYKPAAYGKKVVPAFNQTYEAAGFLAVRESLHRDLVMTICRIWDDEEAADDVLSLPKAMKRLSGSDVRDSICKQAARTAVERHKNSTILTSRSGPSEEEMRAYLNQNSGERYREAYSAAADQIQKLARTYISVKKIPELGSLRFLRNKMLAHSGNVDVDNSHVRKIRTPQWGDEKKVLKRTFPLIEQLGLLVQEDWHNYKDFQESYRFNATAFWRRASKGPTRR